MNGKKKSVVLAIGGSDSSGGAGIQADIKTITMCGSYAASAITAITAQNTQGVQQIKLLEAELVRAQIRAVLADMDVTSIKIGMLGSAKLVAAVANELQGTAIPIILDPVMVAKGGANLLQSDAVQQLKKHLIPMSSLVTPNAPEAEILSGMCIYGVDDQRRAAEQIMEMGAKAVLVKGGHITGDIVCDLLLWSNGETLFEAHRINSHHTHGTGCTLASAIATRLAQGLPLEEAVRLARNYVRIAIKTAPQLGKGNGPLEHLQI